MKEEKFTIKLAVADALPVLFFGIAALVLGLKLHSTIFFVGALICLLAGTGKVVWKFIIALSGKDIPWLGGQLRYLMPIGFILMILGTFTSDHTVLGELARGAVRMPSLLLFIIALVALIGMIVCAGKFDRHDVRGNWIEQMLNIIAQGCVMAGVLLM